MKAAVDSFESHSDGYISQAFLENDVEEGINEVDKTTSELTADAKSINASGQDIVDVEKIDETEVVETVHRGKRRVKEIVEELHDLDQSRVASLHSVKEDLQTMKSFLADMESKFKSGELSVGSYSMKAIRDIDAYQSIKESVDGEDGLIDDSLELILQKMENGETLTDVEQDELYDYTQNIMLDDKKRKEIEDIASFMSEEDIGKLTERLNQKVVVSADALEEEIAMIQAYVFTGDKRPSELDIDRDTKEKLEAYLILLKNYHSTMGDETIAQVNKLEYEKDPNGIKGHYLDTGLEIAEYDSHINKLLSEEEFRQFTFSPDEHMSNTINRTEVTYYTTAKDLKNYHYTMGNETIAQVNKQEYEKDPNGIKGHYLDTGLEIAEYDSHINKLLSEEEFRQFTFSPDEHMSNTINRTEVTYYTTADAAILKDYLETQKMIDKEANYLPVFIGNQIFGKIIGKIGEPVTTAKKIFDYQKGKDKLAEDITIGEAEITAAFLNMEISISENRSYPGPSAELDVQLYPTETTFIFLDRWKEIYDEDQDLPYPADLIRSEDWKGINDYWIEHHTEIESSDEYDYIRHGTE